MCLITEQKTAKIAKSNLVGYKIVDSQRSPQRFYSWMIKHRMIYTLHKKYVTKIEKTYDWSWMDDEVFDYYGDPSGSGSIEKAVLQDELTSIGPGFHSAKTLKRLEKQRGIVVKCIIPKGSEYFEDATGLRVSNQIILKKVVRYF